MSLLKIIEVPEQKIFNGKRFPLCVAPTSASSTLEEILAWLETNRNQVDDWLREYKGIMFRGLPLPTYTHFDQVLVALSYASMEYVGGAAVRTQLTPRIFTSNESPPSEKIPFHHEMAQVPSPPTHLFFYCEVPPSMGGETPILPSAEVVSRLQTTHPSILHQLETHGVRYQRIMSEYDDPSSAIGRGWRSTFNVDNRSDAEAKLQSLGSTWEWLEIGDLKTVTAALPAIRIDAGDKRSNEKTFFNSVVAAFLGWNDSRNKGETAVILGDSDDYCDASGLQAAAAIMDEIAVAIPWQQGDVMLLDNRTVMHSRKPFEPPRRILASLVRDAER